MAKKCYLDANVLVFFLNQNSPFFTKAVHYLETAISRDYELVISSLVLDEFIFSLKKMSSEKKKLNQQEELKIALKKVLSLPNIKILQPPVSLSKNAKVIELMKVYNLKPRDAFHLLTMIEHDIEVFVTFDSDFKKVFAEGNVSPI